MSRRRGAVEEKGPDTGRWLVSYADFITVMMIFFIVLWTTARVDEEKFQQLGQAMSMAFFPTGNLMPQPGPPGAGGLGTGDGEGVAGDGETGGEEGDPWPVDPVSPDPVTSDPVTADPGDWPLPGDVDPGAYPGVHPGLQPGVHPWTGLPIWPDDAGLGLAEQLPDLMESGELQVVRSERGIVISVQNSVLFDSGSAEVRVEALPVLAEVAAALRQIDNNVLVEGYTDNVPIQTAEFPSNWELSSARATNVLRHLLAAGDLEPDRFAAVGYGEYRNIYPNDTEENRQKNRRVDIVILDERQSLNIGQELKPAR